MKGIPAFGSGHSSIIFEHSLKTKLAPSDVDTYWVDGVQAGSDASWITIAGLADGDARWPYHDAELGMKEASQNDEVTEAGYRFINGNGNQTLIDAGEVGTLAIEVEVACIDAYEATYNTDTYQPASRKEFISCFSGAGNDNMRFLTIEAGASNPEFFGFTSSIPASLDMDRVFDGWNLDATQRAHPKILAFSKGRGRFVRLIWSWNGNFCYLAVQDPEDPDQGPIIVSWGRRDKLAGNGEPWAQPHLAGLNGVAGTFLTDYYIRNMTLFSEFAEFSLSSKYPKVLAISDSLIDFSHYDQALYGGVNGTQYGMQRAFHAKGLRTQVEFSENGGQRVNQNSVVTPVSITRSGATITITLSADPGLPWGNNNIISIVGADQKEYNDEFQITEVSPTVYTATIVGTPATPATGTIQVGGSLQLSIQNILNKNPDAGGIAIQALTNDLADGTTAADTLTNYKLLIDKAFAHDNIKFVIAIIPPVRTTGGDTDLQQEYNTTVFSSLESYVASNYPTKIIQIVDSWTSVGGLTPDARTFDGTAIHYAPWGDAVLHWDLYQAMLKVFNS